MVSAQIKINGVVGSRNDITLSSSVALTNNDDTGVISWVWEFLDIPPSSSASLSTPSAASSSFTADVAGSFLIKLTVSDGSDIDTDTVVAAVNTANLDYRIPAAGETTEFDGTDGWHPAVYNALKSIDDFAGRETLPLTEQSSDPSSATDQGTVYTKETSGITELFYIDDTGNITQITNQGAISLNEDGFISFDFDELDPDLTAGTESSLALTSAPVESNALYMFRNGLLMREVSSLSDDYQEYTLSGTTVSFLASNEPGDWYAAKYVDAYQLLGAVDLAATIDAYSVKVSSNDTTAGFLGEKITPGLNITLTQLNDGSDEDLQVDTTETLGLPEQSSDPSNLDDYGTIYSKDVSGYTELHYIDNFGNVTKITSQGAVIGTGGSFSDAYLSLPEQASDPASLDNYGILYTKEVDGYTELHYIDNYGVITQITDDGYLDTFNSLRGVGLFEQLNDPVAISGKGYLYTKNSGGETELFYFDSSGNSIQFTESGSFVGSSVSGVLAERAAAPLASPQTISSEISSSYTDITNLSHTLNVVEGDRILCIFSGQVRSTSAASNPHIALDLDGYRTFIIADNINASTVTRSMSFNYLTDELSAGTHTVKIQAGKLNGADSDFTVEPTPISGTDETTPVFQAVIYRGGLIPVQDSGSTIVSTPNALNFGRNIEVSNNSNTADIEVSEVIGLPEQLSDPTASTDRDGYLYTKFVDGYSELHFMDNYGNIIQISNKGSLL